MHPTSQALRRPLLIISALIASIGALTVGAQLASAHHANIVAADVACSGQVTFTTSAWEGQGEGEELISSRTNSSVDVTYRIADAGADIFVTNGHFDQANGFQFGGSFTWPASNPNSITIYSTPQVPWANNSPGGGFASAAITRPTGCANASASVAVACINTGGQVTVTLVNHDIFGPADFTVGNPTSSATQVVAVPANGTSTVLFAGLPDGSYTVPVLAGGRDLSIPFVVACVPATTTTIAAPKVVSEAPVPTTTVAPAAVTTTTTITTTTPAVASLPATGSSTVPGLLIGAALVAMGGGAAFAARRRRPA